MTGGDVTRDDGQAAEAEQVPGTEKRALRAEGGVGEIQLEWQQTRGARLRVWDGGVVRVGVGVEEEGGRADARIVMDMSQTAGFSVPA